MTSLLASENQPLSSSNLMTSLTFTFSQRSGLAQLCTRRLMERLDWHSTRSRRHWLTHRLTTAFRFGQGGIEGSQRQVRERLVVLDNGRVPHARQVKGVNDFVSLP